MEKRNLQKDNRRYIFLRKVSRFFTRLFLKYDCQDKYEIKDDERILVISNHQTDVDPFLIFPSFNKPLYPVATDNIFAGKVNAKMLNWLGAIPKKKGEADVKSVLSIKDRMKEGGSILLFLEGNRTYAEFQFYIPDSTPRLIKMLKPTLVLFTLHGGTGVSPRFKNKNRKGKFYGKIERVLPFEEYKDMDNDELLKLIKNTIKVFDSEEGNLYKSSRRGEYLEREFFVCPVCGQKEQLYSKKSLICCRNCNLSVEYTEDLHLKSDNQKFTFNRLVDWWNFQKRYIKNYQVLDGEKIFEDHHVAIKKSNPFERIKVLYRGKITLDSKSFHYGNNSFAVCDIESASVVSGRKLVFKYRDNNYTIKGGKRFNPLKYIFMFNKLETKMKLQKTDLYYGIEEDN